MSSIIKVDQIQLSDGSAPSASDLGLNTSGSVINVVRYAYSGSYVNLGIGASSTLWQLPDYTPKSSTSKIIYVSSIAISGDCDGDGHNLYGHLAYYTSIGGTESLVYQTASNTLVARGGHSRSYSATYTAEVTGHNGQDVHWRVWFENNSGSNRSAHTMNNNNSPSIVTLYEIAG